MMAAGEAETTVDLALLLQEHFVLFCTAGWTNQPVACGLLNVRIHKARWEGTAAQVGPPRGGSGLLLTHMMVTQSASTTAQTWPATGGAQ